MQQVLLVFQKNLKGEWGVALPAPATLVPTVLHSNRVATLKASAFVGWDGWGMTPSFNLHGLPPPPLAATRVMLAINSGDSNMYCS